MERTIVNYSIDGMMLIAASLCGCTGIIKWPGLIISLGPSYQEIPIAAITAIHDWSGLALCILAAVHIIIHRRWIIAATRQITHPPGERNA